MNEREGLWPLLVTWGFMIQINSTGPYQCDVKCGDTERGQKFVRVNNCVKSTATRFALSSVNQNVGS